MRKWLALLLCCMGCSSQSTQHASADRWAIYYDKDIPAASFKGYDLVVFDRIYYPKFKALKGKTVVLAYVSIGEVHGDGPEKELLLGKEALRGEQAHWGSHIVDMSSPEWRRMVLAQVGDAVKKGFDGVMLDTVDSAIYAASQKSVKEEKTAQKAAIAMIRDIRKQYPHIKLMLNRGFAILPEVAPKLDYALAESTLVQTDISTGQSKLFPPKSYQLAIGRLEAAREMSPSLKIYTLDYWNQDDVQGIQNIYAMHRAQGFSPYVSTPDLRQFTPEPGKTRHASNEPELVGDSDA